MIARLFRRRRSRTARLLEGSRTGMKRVRSALPGVELADLFADLASRTGVDLGHVAERVFDRFGEAIARAEGEATELAETDTARQLRELAARAAGRAAEIAYRSGAERLLPMAPRQRRSHGGLILLSAALGLVAGGVAIYALSARRTVDRRQLGPTDSTDDASSRNPGGDGTGSNPGPGSERLGGLLQGWREHLQAAKRAARIAQTETERRLWRQYRSGDSKRELLPSWGESDP